jgi:hypothetical protein
MFPRTGTEVTVPDVQIESEQEGDSGWTFRLRLATGTAGQSVRRTVRLDWADYDLWSADGADPPHAVAAAVIEFLLSRLSPSELPASVDASVARRRFPDADQEIPKLIRRP